MDDKIKRLMERNHIRSLERKTDAPKTVTDEIGNKYREEIGTDGAVHLILVESYNGELFD